MIGYLCAYLRYYHPHEFIAAYLNNADNQDDIKNGSDMATVYGITISPPRFGSSRDEYVYDKESGTISKGVASAMYLNKAVANELYNLAKQNTYSTFIDLLLDIKGKTSTNARQRDVLISIGYFSEFGNVTELRHIVSYFTLFKDGDAKSIRKDKVPEELNICIQKYANGVSKTGAELKSYSITDMHGLLAECESIVRSQGLQDISGQEHIENQMQLLGYVDLTTGRKEDRRKLLITDVRGLKSKNGSTWAYVVEARSIGTGKTARLTVREPIYNMRKIKRYDIIFATRLRQERGYWYLISYNIIK